MSFIKLHSYLCNGLEKEDVSIEALKTKGLSQLLLSGLPDAWLKDSRDKMRALVSQRVPWGSLDRVLVHLLPPDKSKFGAHLELPIALAMMSVLYPKPLENNFFLKIKKFKFIGSLSLEGQILENDGLETLMNFNEDNVLGPWHFENLNECWEFLTDEHSLDPPKIKRAPKQTHETPLDQETYYQSFNEVVGRDFEKMWLMAAAIQRLPTLLIGAPGVGKSTLAKWAQKINPWPSTKHQNETRKIYLLASQTAPSTPPQISPHARAHISEYIGYNKKNSQRPGFFSLAHGGTLVLDELLELNRDCREILRNILDEKRFLRNHKEGFTVWPADFWLIATTNPCPCGYSRIQDDSHCKCLPQQRDQYQQKLSGPLADRFAIKLWIEANEKSDQNFRAALSLDEPIDWVQKIKIFKGEHQTLQQKSHQRAQEILGRDSFQNVAQNLHPRLKSTFCKTIASLEITADFLNLNPNFDWQGLALLKLEAARL